MFIAVMLLTIGLVAVVFAAYFAFGSDRIAHRNVLDRRIQMAAGGSRPRRARRADPLETLINRVYVIDERLVRMKAAVAAILLVAGLFLLVVSAGLWAR